MAAALRLRLGPWGRGVARLLIVSVEVKKSMPGSRAGGMSVTCRLVRGCRGLNF